MAGYSRTPLAKKLGIKENFRLVIINEPTGFEKTLGELAPGIKILASARKPLDLILFFTDSHSELTKRFAQLAALLLPNGMLWIAYPKKASGVPTDLNFNFVQTIGLEAGLVDTKICAIDEVWSGVKFVYRLQDRPKEIKSKRKQVKTQS
jgi:hypothetical protein